MTFGLRCSPDDLDVSDEHIKEVLLWSISRISCLQDLISKNMEFLWIIPRQEQLSMNNPGK